MNTFSTTDPAKNLAEVSVRVFQGICVLLFCLSIYLGYLSYLDLLPDWHVIHELSDGEVNFSGGSNSWLIFFFAIPGILSLIGFFLLGYLGKVIHKE